MLKLILILSTLASAVGLAEGGANARTSKKVGAYLGVLEPVPSSVSLNIGYNISPAFRGTFGIGKAGNPSGNLSTWALGVKILMPKWSLAPCLHLNWANVSHSGNGTIKGFAADASHLYLGIGLDYTADSGLFLSIAYNMSLNGGTSSEPSIAIGWFFDSADLF